MTPIYRLICLLLGVMVACTCTKQSNENKTGSRSSQRFSTVAYINATDIETHRLVETILTNKQIEVLWNGSVIHEVVVPEINATAAKTLLQRDTRLRTNWIKYDVYDFIQKQKNP